MAKFTESATDLLGPAWQLQADGSPDECPLCHVKQIPKEPYDLGAIWPENWFMKVFRCTSQRCQLLFMAFYAYNQYSGYYEYRSSSPRTTKVYKFSDEIKVNFPDFVNIHEQAQRAETADLDQVAGMGYRKSLEFLIKDYLINGINDTIKDDKERKKKVEEIEQSFLGICIKKHIDDDRIKDCAERAVWVGNDESHYVKKWEDKNIEDLKVLFRLTVIWIESILLSNKYKKEMQP